MQPASISRARRIAIVGGCGAGKSTLARALGELLNLPVAHLDTHYWQPGWVEVAGEAFDAAHDELIAADAWIIDGNYGRTQPTRFARADAIVLLDYNRLVLIWQVLRRIRAWHGRTRPDMGAGCPEQLDLPFLWYTWNFPRVHGARVRELIDAAEHARPDLAVVRLRSPRQTRDWLRSLRAR